MLEARPGIGDAIEQHALRAKVRDADLALRIELAAPLDGVQQQLAKRVARPTRARPRADPHRAGAITPCSRSAASRVHGTTSSTQSGRADTTSIGGSAPAFSASVTTRHELASDPPASARTERLLPEARAASPASSSDVMTMTIARRAFEALQAIEHVEPVHPRHPDVEQHQIERGGLQLRQRAHAVAGLLHREAGLREDRSHQQPRGAIVIDDEDPGRGAGWRFIGEPFGATVSRGAARRHGRANGPPPLRGTKRRHQPVELAQLPVERVDAAGTRA